jgi:hypothetical protein
VVSVVCQVKVVKIAQTPTLLVAGEGGRKQLINRPSESVMETDRTRKGVCDWLQYSLGEIGRPQGSDSYWR